MSHRQSRGNRRQHGRSSITLLALIVIVIGIVLMSGWLADDERAPGGDPAVVVAPESHGAGTDLPEGPESTPGELAVDAEGNAAAAAVAAGADPEELLEDYPHATVSGRVVLLTPGEMPSDLTLTATNRAPEPVVRKLDLSTILDRSSEFHAISNSALKDRTRVTVGPDGRFEMPGFPKGQAVWIGAEHSEWYQPRAKLHEAPLEGGELVVELAFGATVRGRVVDSEGQPVEGLSVKGGSTLDRYAMAGGNAMVVRMPDQFTDADGRFEFAPTPTEAPIVLSTAAQSGLQPTKHKVGTLVPGQVVEASLVVTSGGVIEGLVIDLDDQPVPNTQVSVQPTTLNLGEMDMLGLVTFDSDKHTDGMGRFRFDSLAPGTYQLFLSKGGYLSTRSDPIELASGQVVSDLTLRADPGLSVSGTVTGPDGEPVEGSRVLGFLPPSMFNMQAATDKNRRASEKVDDQGRFTLWGYDEGDVRVRASAKDYVTASVDTTAGASDVVIQLQRKESISGIAIDLSTGEPLTAYTLQITPSSGLFDMSALTEMDQRIGNLRPPLDVSHEEGKFVMDDVTPDTYDLVLTADGFARTTREGIEVVEGDGTSGVIFMVPEEAAVIGQVISGRTGQPLQDVTVTTGKTDTISSFTQMLTAPVPKTTTDADGRFTLGGLGDQRVTVTLQHEEYRSVALNDLSLRSAEVHDAGLITMPAGGTIHGTVYGVDAQPQAGVAVMASDSLGQQMKRATTDAEGTYLISGLDARTFNVMRMDFSLGLDSENMAGMLEGLTYETVTLELDEVKQVDLGLPAESGCRLEGVVRGAGGPEADATVVVVRETGAPATRFTSTDEHGRYEVADLQPGPYMVQVVPSGSMPGVGGQPSSTVISSVLIGDVPVQRHDIEVPGAVLRGEVRARRGGERLPGIRVLLERVDEARPASRFIESMGGRVGETYTDEKGEFRFEHLPSGTFAVQAGGTNVVGLGEAGWAVGRVDDIAVSEDSDGLEIVVELDPGGAVTGIVRGPRNQPLGNVPVWARSDETGRWLSVLSEVTTDASGHYTINSLQPGPWTLAFGGDDWGLTLVAGVQVRLETVTERDVDLEKGVEVFAELGPYSAGQLTAQIQGPQGAVPTGLTSMTALVSGSSSASGRMRLGRLRHGTYNVSLFADGALILQDVVSVGKNETEVVVSLPDDG